MRVKVELDDETFSRLVRLAGSERRTTGAQAEYLLMQALRRRIREAKEAPQSTAKPPRRSGE